MPDVKNPRRGSMQFWPRKRAKRIYPRIRSHNKPKEAQLSGFAGYKVGMTHVIVKDNNKNSLTKGTEISFPVTVLEAPPIKVLGVRFYKKDSYGKLYVVKDIVGRINDKNLKRKIRLPKKDKSFEEIEFDEARALCYTQPSKIKNFKKKPEVFEVGVGGSKEDQLSYLKSIIGKEIKVSDIFKEGSFVDVYAITKGKGTQGPVKRFGVKIRSHKAEKTKRGPGSIAGGWKAQGHMMYRVAFAGQTGYHQRYEMNKQIIAISDDFSKLNPKGGFVRYGEVSNEYILLKGSLPGAVKRTVYLTFPKRFHKAYSYELKLISQESKQK
jgi:large subunit ribosomal protein L3